MAESLMEDEEDFDNGLLLRDIEEISKALYLHKNPAKAFNAARDHRVSANAKTGAFKSKSEVRIQDPLRTGKKSSIWNWKPLKALAHIRNQRFNCCFFLYVHAIEELPANFENLNLSVAWERKGDLLRTCSVPVIGGIAEFEETLMYRCTVYANRMKNPNSAKYEPKIFSLCTSIIGLPELDIGKHWIDLTRLLPLTMEELAGERRSSGKWMTSFKLSGRAKGAILNVSFGFSILDGNSFEPGYFVKVPGLREPELIRNDPLTEFVRNSGTYQLHNLGSVPAYSRQAPRRHQSQSVDMNFISEIFPDQGSELSHSVTLLYQKLDEGKTAKAEGYDIFHESLQSLKSNLGPSPGSVGRNTGRECNDPEFTVIEQSIEASHKDQVRIEADDYNLQGEEREADHGSQRFDSSLIETIDIEELFLENESTLDDNVDLTANLDENDNGGTETEMDTVRFKENSRSLKELDFILCEMMTSRSNELDSLLDMKNYYEKENYNNFKLECNTSKLDDSCSLDDVAESIENDFLSMLLLETSTDALGRPNSIRDFTFREIEENDVGLRNPISDTSSLAPNCYARLASADDDDALSFAIEAVGKSHDSIQSLRSKKNGKLLEDLETESLMHEWGLNERAFQNSPRCNSGAFGSPVYTPAKEPLKLPSLLEGVGPIIRTRDRGFLRSMNPLLFRDAKNGARLVVQVSAPVVLPAAMGLTAMDILLCWASGGAEMFSTQTKELMPLEDITGKKVEELASEAKSRSDASERWCLQHESEGGSESRAAIHLDDIDSECVSFDNLVPAAITNIEGLLIEGLKIQSGMPDQESPSSIRIQSSLHCGYEGKTAVLYGNLSSDVASGSEVWDVNELVKLSISLEKWLRLDSGIDAKDELREDIFKVIVTYGAKGAELIKEDGGTKELDKRCGIFDDKFTMALRLQLRDPFRDYEMVGSSMLALLQVKREFSVEENSLDEKLIKEEINFEQEEWMMMYGKRIPVFRFLDVHLTGLSAVGRDRKFLGANREQQSGYRWLLSSGMARSNKHNISSLNALVNLPSRSEGRNVLWSISSCTGGEPVPWDDLVALNVHIRNPDIILPNDSSFCLEN